MTRFRSKPPKVYNAKGYKYVYRGSTTNYVEPSYSVDGDISYDELSPGYPTFLRDNDLLLHKQFHTPATFSGTMKKTSSTGEYIYDETLFRETWIVGKEGTPEDMSYWHAMAVSQMDPRKPVVNMPVELIELLTELPFMLVSLLRDLRRPVSYNVDTRYERVNGFVSSHTTGKPGQGRTYIDYNSHKWVTTYTPSFRATLARSMRDKFGPSSVAGSYVMGAFGIMPLLDLLHKLINFDGLMQKRMRELNALENRKIRNTLDDKTYPGGTTVTTGTWLSVPYTQTIQLYASKKVWYTADWYWMNRPSFLGDSSPGGVDKFNSAYNYMRGVDGIYLEDLWEVLPFSWLVDYFTNVGAVIGAYGGLARFQARNLNVMCEKKYTYTCDLKYRGSAVKVPSMRNGAYVTHYQQRKAGGQIPGFAFSERLLSSHQIAILSSILYAFILSTR